LFKCHREGHCELDKHTRKYCRRCRLSKCFWIGMRRELIARTCTPPALDLDAMNCEEPVTLDRLNVFSNEHTTELKHAELLRIKEVHKAVAVFTDETSYPLGDTKVNSISQVVNLAGWNVKEVIKFCKGLPSFASLSPVDQLSLLKCFYPEKTCVRCAFLYSVEKDGWVGVQSELDKKSVFVSMKVLKTWTKTDIFSIFRNFVYCLHIEMEDDGAIRDLILALLLFKPHEGISTHLKEFLHYNQIVYSYLLRRYLEHKYGNVEHASRKYSALNSLMGQLDSVTASMKIVYAGVQEASQLAEVLAEIYDLA